MVEPNVTDELFDTAIMDEEAVKGFSDPGQQLRPKTWKLYWRRLLKRPAALVGTIVFCMVPLSSPFSALGSRPYDYQEQDAKLRLATPTLSHPFGADQFGRDILSRVIVGTRNIFLLGGFGTLVAVVIGTAIGLASGYVGGTTDEVVMRSAPTCCSASRRCCSRSSCSAPWARPTSTSCSSSPSSTSRWSRAWCAAWCSTSRTRSSSRPRACAARRGATRSSARSSPTRSRLCWSRPPCGSRTPSSWSPRWGSLASASSRPRLTGACRSTRRATSSPSPPGCCSSRPARSPCWSSRPT